MSRGPFAGCLGFFTGAALFSLWNPRPERVIVIDGTDGRKAYTGTSTNEEEAERKEDSTTQNNMRSRLLAPRSYPQTSMI